MDVFIALIPFLLLIAVYIWGYRRFKARHEPEVAGPQGQRPYGVHGWLAFFIFASYYIAPLFSLGALNSNFMKAERDYPDLLMLSGYKDYKSMLFVVAIAIIVWQIIIAMRLRWKLEPQSLRSARIFCFAAPAAMIAADIFFGSVFLDVTPDGKTMASYFGSLIASSVWGLYFLWSKRCKNTYLDASAEEQVSTVVGAGAFEPPAGDQASQPVQMNAETPLRAAAGSHEGKDVAQRLNKLNELKQAGLLTEQEYEDKRREILSAI